MAAIDFSHIFASLFHIQYAKSTPLYINTHKGHSYLKNVLLQDSQGAQERQPRTQHSDMGVSNTKLIFIYMNKVCQINLEKGNGVPARYTK